MGTKQTAVAGPVERVVGPLRPYMCWAGDPDEGAVLAWAHTAQDARKLAFPAIADWTDAGFIDVRARLLKQHVEYLQTLKLKDAPHVNDNPPTCAVCDLWGNPPHPSMTGCMHCCDGDERPNVRAKRATTAGRQARAGENVPRTTRPGLVACRCRSA